MRQIYYNAKIATMDHEHPFADAMAVENGKIIYVGDSEEAKSFAEPDSELRNLEGGFLMPGFNDSHMHFLHYVKKKLSVNLAGTKSIEDIIERMKKRLEHFDPDSGLFLIGESWNQDLFTEGEKRFPTADDLDRISMDVPVIILRACFHIGVLNHKAMEVLGLDKKTILKAGSFAELGPNGEPNGIVKENFLEEIKTRLPYPSLDALFSMVLDSQKDLFEKGITTIQTDDMKYAPKGENYNYLNLLRKASEDGRLKVRYSEQALVETYEELDRLLSWENLHYCNEHFSIPVVKILSDGSLGARTAFLKEYYADMPGVRGLPIYTQEELDHYISKSNQAGMSCAVHAIGNGAMEMCLSAYEKSQNENPDNTFRNGIVHCQITEKEQLERMKDLGLQAYTQPIFLDYDMHIVEDRVGKNLSKTSYAWKSYLDLGIHESFGTDCPVEDFDPLPGIWCAVTRKDKNGNGPYLPKEAVSVYDSLFCYTAAGSFSNYSENICGKIQEGFLADFIILDKDLTSIPPEEIMDTKVLETYIDGNCVYKR